MKILREHSSQTVSSRFIPQEVLAQLITHLDSLPAQDRKSTRLNSSHSQISYAVFCLKQKTNFALSTFRLPSQPNGGQFRLVTGAKPKAALFRWPDYNDAPLARLHIAENCSMEFGIST